MMVVIFQFAIYIYRYISFRWQCNASLLDHGIHNYHSAVNKRQFFFQQVVRRKKKTKTDIMTSWVQKRTTKWTNKCKFSTWCKSPYFARPETEERPFIQVEAIDQQDQIHRANPGARTSQNQVIYGDRWNIWWSDSCPLVATFVRCIKKKNTYQINLYIYICYKIRKTETQFEPQPVCYSDIRPVHHKQFGSAQEPGLAMPAKTCLRAWLSMKIYENAIQRSRWWKKLSCDLIIEKSILKQIWNKNYLQWYLFSVSSIWKIDPSNFGSLV